MLPDYFDQRDFTIRFEWGPEGLKGLRPDSELVIVLDVLSFSTCVDIATARGASVIPYRFKDDSLEAFAASIGATAATRTRTPEQFSLSPRSLLAISEGTRLVLPSPNGALLSLLAADGATITGCLRNVSAVACYAQQYKSIAVIAAGERWLHDGSLRPAVEDLIGAGAIISKLAGTKSPEALAAQAAFEAASKNLTEAMFTCSSGRELILRGDREDVILASQLDVSGVVPVLRDGEYRDLTGV